MKLSHKIYYMSGQLGMMLSARYFFQWILNFAPTVEFSAAALGTLIFAYRIYDAVTDPLAGFISDKFQKTSRIKLMNYSIPFFAVGLILCFFPDLTMSQNIKWICEFFGMLLFFTGYTFYCIPYWALIGDYEQNDSTLGRALSNLLGLGLLLATGIGFIFTPKLVTELGFFSGSIAIALISSILMLLPNLCTKAPKLNPEFINGKNIFTEVFHSIYETFRNKKFLKTCILFVGSQMSLTIMTAAAPFIATNVLGGSKSDVAFLMGPMLLVAIPSFFISQKLSKIWGWEKSVLRATLLLAGLYCITSFVGKAIIVSPLVTAAIVFSFSGLPIAILLGLEAEAVTNCARDSKKVSTHFGAINFLIKTFNGLALMIAGIVCDHPNYVWSLPMIAGSFLFIGLIVASRINTTST